MAKTKARPKPKARAKKTSGPTDGTAGISGAVIASDAVAYVGKAQYVWGGAPGTQIGVDAGTDCSGFTSMVLGRDLGIAIPGFGAGAYNGSQHGPVVSDYIAWDGATTLGKNETPLAGDLVCYGPDTHIGIATSATDFVSALNPELGVTVTGINGAASGTVIFRRVNGAGATPTGEGGTGTAGVLGSAVAAMLAPLGLGVGAAGAAVVVVVVVGAVVSFAGSALLAMAIRRGLGL